MRITPAAHWHKAPCTNANQRASYSNIIYNPCIIIVILSACNTGVEDPLSRSGLVQAFFRAGSRALLVTNWNIQSQMATDLSTNIFQQLNHHPDMRRAEALRRTMLSVLEPGNKTWRAHPYFWAAFVNIGSE